MTDTATHPVLGSLGPELLPYLKGGPGLYVTGEERLRLRSFNSAAAVRLNLEARVLRLDGSISPLTDPHIPNTDRTEATTQHAIGEGWLQHVNVRAVAGTPRRGQCFIVVDIVRGQTNAVAPLGIVLQGYAKDTTGLAWPGSPLIDSPDGPGVILSLAGADPAAGAEMSETVPTNARWRLLGVDIPLVTDATVANREVVLTIDDGANIVAEIASGTSHVASTTRRYSFARNVQRGAGATALTVNAPIPDAILMGGYRVRTVTTNLQAADNFGAPRLWVEEWIED